MRIERISVRGRMARTVRLLASLCLVAAFAYAVPPAAAASSQQFDVHELAAVSAAVDRSGVGGIAWYVDAASDRVVVTADRSVSAAELATIKRSAGAGAG
jgi:streptogrisin B